MSGCDVETRCVCSFSDVFVDSALLDLDVVVTCLFSLLPSDTVRTSSGSIRPTESSSSFTSRGRPPQDCESGLTTRAAGPGGRSAKTRSAGRSISEGEKQKMEKAERSSL